MVGVASAVPAHNKPTIRNTILSARFMDCFSLCGFPGSGNPRWEEIIRALSSPSRTFHLGERGSASRETPTRTLVSLLRTDSLMDTADLRNFVGRIVTPGQILQVYKIETSPWITCAGVGRAEAEAAESCVQKRAPRAVPWRTPAGDRFQCGRTHDPPSLQTSGSASRP